MKDNFKRDIPERKKHKSKRNRTHARTLTTYQNKIRKLQSFYNRHPKIKAKYPTFEAWVTILKVKPAGKERERKVYTPSTLSKTDRKKGAWGI